jgi:hypothetical protein
MLPKQLLARLCGCTYLILILSGIFGLIYVPSTLIDWTNPAITVSNIKGAELLFRLGILSEILCFLAFIALPLLLYELLKTAGRVAAALMAVFALICIPMAFINIVKKVDVLLLLGGEPYLSAMTQEHLNAQIMYLLASFNNGTLVANIFWGAWLFPFGYLAYTSGLLPKILGIFLILGGFGYITEFLLRFLVSGIQIPWYISIPGSIGEFGMCLWLLIMGVNERQPST